MQTGEQSGRNITAAYAVAVFVIIVWGAMPAATQFAVNDIDPAPVGALRSIIAAALLLPALLLTRAPLPNGAAAWGALAVSSVVGFVIYQIVFSVGIAMTSTAHAALILATAPLFTGVFGFIVERRWPGGLWWVGGAIAMIGEAVLISARPAVANAGSAALDGDLVLLAGTALIGAAYVAGGRLSLHIGTWPAMGWSLTIAGILLVPVFLVRFDETSWTEVTAAGWAGLFYVATISSMIGYAGWYWALARAGAARIAPVQFAQPLVSLVIAVVVLSEAVTAPIVVATVLILSGIALTRRG